MDRDLHDRHDRTHWAYDHDGRFPPLGGTARIVATLLVVTLGVIVLVVLDTRA